jgi:TPP-dependent pyruvate/acetoin dehydrogenase alpha subunit
MFDAELYRDKSEVEEWKKRDPIPTLQKDLLSKQLIDEIGIKTLEQKIEKEIEKAIGFAEAGSWEPAGELTKFVYTEPK